MHYLNSIKILNEIKVKEAEIDEISYYTKRYTTDEGNKYEIL